MEIAVEIMGNYKSIVGNSIVKVSVEEGASVMDLIEALAMKYGEEFTKEVYKPLTAPDAGSLHARTPLIVVNGHGISARDDYEARE